MSETRAYFHNIRDTVTPSTQAFIDGQYCDAADGAKLENLNPATGEIIGTFSHCGAADVDRAVAAARRVFNQGTW